MATKYDELQSQQIEFIEKQHLFFVGSAGEAGFVNVSPKGMDSLRILSPRRLIWLNFTGSGNESAAHVLENSRMTILLCSFDQQPLILRIYGKAEVVCPKHKSWPDLLERFPCHSGARQIFDLSINLVQTSCGFAVPFYEFKSDRDTLANWAEKKGPSGIKEYWSEKNMFSLNGRETGIGENQ